MLNYADLLSSKGILPCEGISRICLYVIYVWKWYFWTIPLSFSITRFFEMSYVRRLIR